MARSEFAEEFADLVEQDEAYRERIQRALIPRELLLLPEAFARFQARVEERFTQVDQEIANVRAEMREGFARVDARFVQVDTEIASVRAEMREGFARVDEQFAEVRAEQQRQAAEQRRQANDIAKLKGFVLELIFDRRAPVSLRALLAARASGSCARNLRTGGVDAAPDALKRRSRCTARTPM
jgi:uncharacterized protein with HEPN domain